MIFNSPDGPLLVPLSQEEELLLELQMEKAAAEDNQSQELDKAERILQIQESGRRGCRMALSQMFSGDR